MSLTIKAYILSGRSKTDSQEIRRFNVSENTAKNYLTLQDKVWEVFPSLNRRGINLHWKDNDGDLIHFTSDVELAEALRTAADGVFKVFIQEKSKSQGNFHPGIMCNKCGKQVQGNRYKCLICQDYELCEDCENLRVHLEHAFIRIPSPNTHWMPLIAVSSSCVSPAVKNKSLDSNQSAKCNASPYDYQPPLQSRPGFAAAMCDPFMHDWSLLSESAGASSLNHGSAVSRIRDPITPDEDVSKASGSQGIPRKPMSRSLFDFDDDDDDDYELPKASKPSRSEGKPILSSSPKDKNSEEKPLASIKPKPKVFETNEHASNDSTIPTFEGTSPTSSSFALSESLENSYVESRLGSRKRSHSPPVIRNRNESEDTDTLALTDQAAAAAALAPEDIGRKDTITKDNTVNTNRSRSNSSSSSPAHVDTTNNSTEEHSDNSREENAGEEAASNDVEDNRTTTDAKGAKEKPNLPIPSVDYNLYYPKVRRYAEALDNLLGMGFTNEGGWLSLLVEEKRGDIIRVLDFIENNVQKYKETEQAKTRQ
ncbi:sequestosome-1-like [Argonauta hians]